MRSHSLLQLLPLLGVLVVDVVGEQIQVKLPKPSRDQNGGCHLPDVINIGLLRHQTNSQWELQLRRNDVISKNRMAHVMSRDADGKTVVEHVELGGQETKPLQAYHNHQEGAAVVVSCTTLNTDSPVLVMEGSLFIGGQKFRLSPAARWRQEAEIESNHVAAVYNLNSIQEFHPRDATSIAAPNKGAKSIVKRPARRRDQRVKRQTPVYYIDVLPVVDPEMYQQWTDRTERTADVNTTIYNYLATLFTSVSMRLNTLNLSKGRKLELRMLHPFFIIDRGLAPYGIVQPDEKGGILLNATDVLTSFKDWIGMFSSETQLYDHAVLFTGHDMSGGTDSGINFNVTKGVAYTREMCNEKLSISIVGDKGAYQSEGVTAHELGHSLGAEHDGHGESTSCRSEDRFIMADSSYPQTAQNSDNPWVFSPCSSSSIDKYLEEIEGNDKLLSQCLERAIGDPVNKNTTIRADDQCRIFYGQDSFVCREEESPAFSEICHEFFCYNPGTGKCVKMTPATGTCCGPQKKCVMGACVTAAAGECPLDEDCPFDDVKSYETLSGGAKCEDAPTRMCYDELFRQQCCNTCKKARSSQTGCPYGDKQDGCQKAECGSKFKDGEFADITYDFVCCKTCAGVNQGCADTESNINFEGSSTTCTELLVNQGRRDVCYQSMAHFNACCDTCEKLRDHSSHSCSWGDHRDCSSLWNTPIWSTCASLNGQKPDVDLQSECCETCPLIEQRQQTTEKPTNKNPPIQKPSTTPASGGDSLFVAEPFIDVNPAEINLGITSTLDVNCTFSLDNHPGMAALISLVLSRANAVGQQFQDLAAITEFSPDSVNLLTQEKVSAIGVNRQTGETFLHLRWDYPTAQQAGVYQCSAHGVDNIGYNVELTNTSLVTVDEADLNDILQKLKQMEMHESVLDQQIQSLQNEKISMQQNIQNLNTNISYLENIVDLLQPVALLQPVGKYQNSYYYVSKEGYDDVHKGIDVCTSLGGHLAIINDQDEFNAIQGFLGAASGFTHVVISGTDEDEEGTWVITNSNTPLPFTFWGQGRPNTDSGANCVMLTGNNWHMIDDGCHFNRVLNYVRFMCELPSA